MNEFVCCVNRERESFDICMMMDSGGSKWISENIIKSSYRRLCVTMHLLISEWWLDSEWKYIEMITHHIRHTINLYFSIEICCGRMHIVPSGKSYNTVHLFYCQWKSVKCLTINKCNRMTEYSSMKSSTTHNISHIDEYIHIFFFLLFDILPLYHMDRIHVGTNLWSA